MLDIIKKDIKIIKLKIKYNKKNKIRTYKIGDNVELGKHTDIGIDADIRSGVSIGDYSYVNKGTVIASGIIGKYCSIGYNCQIGMFEHPVNYISSSKWIYHDTDWKEIHTPPIIGNDVWIASNVTILQGVKVGDGAIIAAGAVVTKDVQPYSIYGGVPAKLIKYRFDEQTIKELLEIEWWNKSEEWIKLNKQSFTSKERFFNTIK